ncbi:beta-ketoacyl synthase N-terminal-like domain-containing protein [Metabacillus sp. HB246100]
MSKIVVTGYGIRAPGTENIECFRSNLMRGICCLDTVTNLTYKNETTIVGLIEDLGIDDSSQKEYRRLPRTALLGIAAGKEAITYARLHHVKNKRIGVFFGISLGNTGSQEFQAAITHSNENKYRKIPITFGHLSNTHSITASISYFLGGNDVTKTITTGCTSSLEAVQDARIYLKSGLIDIAIVGGVDSPISKAASFVFSKTNVLPLNQSLEEGAIPFQSTSKGFAMSEGAGVIILEREEDAQKRGVNIIGEIEDVVSNNDGQPIYSQDTSGDQLLKALRAVVKNRRPDYVNSQALGIQVNDLIEKRASYELFQHEVVFTSIKSMIGNPFGAVGIMQVISSLLSIEYGFIPPTIRTNQKGFEEMKIVRNLIVQQVNSVAITNHGYGGNNAAAYIKRR